MSLVTYWGILATWLAALHWTTARREGFALIGEKSRIRILVTLALAGSVFLPLTDVTGLLFLLSWITARELWWFAKDRWLAAWPISRFQVELGEIVVQTALISGWVLTQEPPEGPELIWGGVYTEPWVLQILVALLAWRIFILQGAEWVSALLEDLEEETGHEMQVEQEAELTEDADQKPGATGAGRMIGIIERSLILVLAMAGHMGAIGLVLAAKSLARFEALKEQHHFAEFYLIGTLFSTLIAILGGVASLRAFQWVAGL